VLTGLLLLAVAVLCYRRFVVGYPDAPAGLAVLHRGEAAFVQAAAEAIFPSAPGLAVSGADARLPHSVDRQLAGLPRTQALQIRALLLAFEHLPLLVPGAAPGRRRRFSSHPPASRISILERLATHPSRSLRMLLLALRSVLVLGYLGHPSNLGGLGIAPFEIEPGVSDAERLFPRIGGLPSSIPESLSGAAEASAGRGPLAPLAPLDPRGPRHRAYAHAAADDGR